MPEEKIWIITDSEPLAEPFVDRPDGLRGWGDELQQRVQTFREKQLDVAELERKMDTFLHMVGRIFNQAEQQSQSKMKLDEIELSIEISAEGEIKLVAGGKVGGKSAIKLKFKRVA